MGGYLGTDKMDGNGVGGWEVLSIFLRDLGEFKERILDGGYLGTDKMDGNGVGGWEVLSIFLRDLGEFKERVLDGGVIWGLTRWMGMELGDGRF